MSKIEDRQQQPAVGDPAVRVAGHLFVALGTSANQLLATASRWDPRIMRRAVGVDGEDDMLADGDSFTINNGSADDYARVRAWQTLPVVKNDGMLPHLEIPGAWEPEPRGNDSWGTCATTRKGPYSPPRSATWCGKRWIAPKWSAQTTVDLSRPFRVNDGRGHRRWLPADCGARHHCRHPRRTAGRAGVRDRPSPGSQVLRRPQPRKRTKNAALADGLLKELTYLQDRENLLDFADKMEVFVPDDRDRLLDEVVEYFGSNWRNVTFSMPETFARVAANIRVSFNPAWSWVHIERDECNANAQC